LLSAISFPLPGGFETFTRWKRAPPGAHRETDRQIGWFACLFSYAMVLP
jgi:hypothetical protein